MADQRARRAFHTLWDAFKGGRTVAALPEDVRPRTRGEGYAVQRHFESVTSEVVGWKIAATSRAGQKHIGVSGPMAGRMLAERMVEPGKQVSLDGNFMHLAELEFAFRMATDFAPRSTRYSVDEVLDGTGKLFLSWEMPSTRYDDAASVGEAQLIADNACGFDVAIVPAADQGWRGADLAALPVRATTSSGLVHEGTGGQALGGPLLALTWLVNELSGLGITLRAGQLVTTGTCITPVPVAPGDTVTADYGRFGTHRLRF